MPFAIDPIACSRTPKWRWRPSGVARWNEPAVLTSVFVDGARSASPPIRCGTRGETAASTAPLASRVAVGVSAGKRGRSWSQPGGSVRSWPCAPLGREVRERAPPGVEPRLPVGLRARAGRERGPEARERGLRQEERGLERPAERLLRPAELGVPQRLAVGLVGPGLLRRAVADDGPHGDEGRAGRLRPRGPDRGVDRVQVVPVVDGLRVPAEPVEPPRHVLGEGERRLPRERHLVVVVERDQLAEPEMPGERRRLRGDAFHEVAVRAQHVGVVIDHLVARAG